MRLERDRKARLSRQAGVLVVAVALTLLAACSSGSHQSQAQAQAQGRASSPAATRTPRQYISFTSYPGWIQGSIPPGKFNYAPWTVISDFGLWPTTTGGIAAGDMGSLSNIPAVVAAARRAGKKIIMAVGEQGLGPAFASAASPRYQPTLITNITSYVAKYGFDGVDIDWEEDVPQNEASYVSLIKNLRATFQREFPKPVFLSADVDTGQVPPGIAARIAGT